MSHPHRILAFVAAMSCAASCFGAAATKPLKVFILAGQSNMEGQAVADLDGKDYNDGRGTLNFLMRDPAKAPLLKHLKDDRGRWTVRDDVWVRYKPDSGPVKAGPLTLGFTVYGGRHHFGPELQFGHVMGDHFDNQVLLIKTAWGGKSLYRDFRPPSSGGGVGPYYTKMLVDVREALANLKTDFPSYDGGGYELAGFVWYHGWNDGCEPKTAVPEYEQNLVNFIRDVRKDLSAPRLPFVIGELTGPWVQAPGQWATLRKAQAAAAARPEFHGNVLFVETHDFVRKPEDSPNPGHGHHEFGNAETYFLVGDALGKGMKRLLKAGPAKRESSGSRAAAIRSDGATSKPNIILCMTDDQGWGDVSYNGLKQIRTPVLDSMAAAGLRFNRFYAQQSCSPTRASVMTGRHPNRMGVFWPGMPLRRQEVTVAQAARTAGYVTGHFGKWHLNGVAGPGKPIAASDPLGPGPFGFDEWFSVSNYFDLDWTFSHNGEKVKVTGDGSDAIVAQALKFIDQSAKQDKPFLACVWFGNPHAPHKPLPADLKAAGGAAYFGEIVGIDRSMGTLRSGLRKLGIADNTLVWFCSDNGGWQDPARPDANGTTAGLRGRKGDMWEGGIRVPAVIEWPARIEQPAVTEMPAGVIDIYPTIVDILKVKVPNQVEPLDGISLLPLVEGQMKQRPKPLGFWQYNGTANINTNSGPSAWSDNRYKLVKLGRNKYELYDLTVDLSEQTDLAAKHPAIVNRMKAELESWQQSVLRSYRGEDYPGNRPAGDRQATPGPVQKVDESLTASQPVKGPLKVFILAGQSNMDGQANVSTIGFLGEDKEHGHLLDKFKPDGKTLVTRDDVWVAHRGAYGKLGPGYGARKSDDKLGNCIGPEYAFGYFMGEAMAEQVVLIKYATGGQSLYQNFRPPSAGLPDPLPAKTKPEDFGNRYRGLVSYVHETLDNLKRHFPAYDERAGYEICGFVWFQGYNDLFVPEKDRKAYGNTLVCLINDLRKEFKAPEMRVVVGVMGVNGPRNESGKQKEVRDGQRFVNTVGEFKGTVKAIETAPLLHPTILELKCAGWLYPERDLTKNPITPEEQAMLARATSNQGFHYFGEGRFFILLGKRFAETMLELLGK